MPDVKCTSSPPCRGAVIGGLEMQCIKPAPTNDHAKFWSDAWGYIARRPSNGLAIGTSTVNNLGCTDWLVLSSTQ
jgi:hypothetical protein